MNPYVAQIKAQKEVQQQMRSLWGLKYSSIPLLASERHKDHREYCSRGPSIVGFFHVRGLHVSQRPGSPLAGSVEEAWYGDGFTCSKSEISVR
jgi:hypothetical protein